MGKKLMQLFVFVCVTMILSCAPANNPIEYGKDICANCSMVIMDAKFGAEAVNKNGKAFKFDSIECLLRYLKENPNVGFAKMLVCDFEGKGELIPSQNLVFIQNVAVKSPMGGNYAAFKNESAAQKYFGGSKIFKNLSEILKTL